MRRIYWGIILVFWTVLALSPRGVDAKEPGDVIARVGDQIITLHQIDTMINSSSIVGVGVPAVGSAERNRVRIIVLDKVVSADLLYLDALKKGADKIPVYQADVKRYAESLLASRYKDKVLMGEIPVTEKEVREYFDKNIQAGTEWTDDVKLAIGSIIRKQRYKEKKATLRDRLRKGVGVVLKEKELDPGGDATRKSSTVVATVDRHEITWGEVRSLMTSPGRSSVKERKKALEQYIDKQIMIQKGKEAGLEKDRLYLARLNEYKKTHLINIHRATLIDRFSPTDKEIREYFKKNKDRIEVREVRDVQMVVLKTKEEAEDVKKKIQSGEITIFEAARDYSIDPNAKKTLGEIGWVSEGTGFPELSKLTFSLEVGELGGPVESPAGWHLVKVLDIRNAMDQSLDDKKTWKKTRRMLINDKLNKYVVDLRLHEFPVEFYEDVFHAIIKREAEKFRPAEKKQEKATAK